MILVMDVGNTNVKAGIFDGDNLVSSWRVSTEFRRTADEYGMIFYDLLNSVHVRFGDIEGVAVASVAPLLNYTIEHMCDCYVGRKPLFVSSDLETGLKYGYYNPAELGADRIVVSAAAHRIYGGPVIAVDFGSATTFNAVNGDGVFLGGLICAGIKTASESLAASAAMIPRFELRTPRSVLGRSTLENLQAGAAYGFAGQVKYVAERIRMERGMGNAKIVATGGLSEIIVSADPSIIDVVDRSLSLKGLKLVHDLNPRKGGAGDPAGGDSCWTVS